MIRHAQCANWFQQIMIHGTDHDDHNIKHDGKGDNANTGTNEPATVNETRRSTNPVLERSRVQGSEVTYLAFTIEVIFKSLLSGAKGQASDVQIVPRIPCIFVAEGFNLI